MKLFSFTIMLWLFTLSGALAQKTENIKEKNNWFFLFDKETFKGWQKLADTGWVIKNEELRAQAFKDGKQKDIISINQFANFKLSFEFKMSKGTNSGIKYLVTNNFPGYKGEFLGLEYQIVDELNFIYPERGIYRSLASLYDLIPANKDGIISINKWNGGEIIVDGNHIEHWLNGNKVVEFDRSTENFNSLVKKSKYRNMKNFGKAEKGHILLQNEGTPIEFRNIKIKIL